MDHERSLKELKETLQAEQRRRAVALHPAAVPGTSDGQELDLPAVAQRGDPKHYAGPLYQGKAR
jgi:hypothetical protein